MRKRTHRAAPAWRVPRPTSCVCWKPCARAARANASFDLPFWPGRGFGLGFTVLTDPLAAATPESVGSWRMGGTYGHSWFVDPAQELSVVAFTNTALEGMVGPFVTELCQALYGVMEAP